MRWLFQQFSQDLQFARFPYLLKQAMVIQTRPYPENRYPVTYRPMIYLSFMSLIYYCSPIAAFLQVIITREILALSLLF